MVIFVRRFAAELLAALQNVEAGTLHEKAQGNFAQIRQAAAYGRLVKLFKAGIALEQTVDMGIHLTSKSKPSSADPSTWCWMCVSLQPH